MRDGLRQEKAERNMRKFWGIFILSCIVFIMISETAIALLLTYLERSDSRDKVLTVPLYIMPFVSLAFTAGLLYVIRARNRKVELIIESMNKVAEGDYTVRITEPSRTKEFERIFTNFNKMVEELSSVKTLRENFIHDFSHEFKTPISSIHGFADLLLDGGTTDEEQKRILQIISEESDRLWKLADNTLFLSKLENQQLAGETEIIKLDEQLKDAVIMLASEWEKKNISLSSELAPAKVRGNSTLLMQVWVNLITNAVKFTSEGGEIKVGLTVEDGVACVTVSDNGMGMDAQDIAHIFEKSYRAEDAASTEGNGLGLAICKRICDLSGGEISVKSAKGKGSVFTVKLNSCL